MLTNCRGGRESLVACPSVRVPRAPACTWPTGQNRDPIAMSKAELFVRRPTVNDTVAHGRSGRGDHVRSMTSIDISSDGKGNPFICFAHVTNQMAQIAGDFEKGEADGSVDALDVIARAAKAWFRLGV